MKRHVQQTGIRQWAGEDLLELQSEPLKALDGFFAEYGNCVIKGCDIVDNGDGSYNISPGLVALSGIDTEGKDTFKVVPFAGVESTPLSIYLTLAYSSVERAYIDNKVKPIAYNYYAAVSAIKPVEAPYIELSQDNVPRFMDVIQNSSRRFFTDVERKKLQGIEQGVHKYIHPDKHPATVITEDELHRFMTASEKTKLNGIETNANRYVHPANHSASMIIEDATRRFMTDTEKSKLAGMSNYNDAELRNKIQYYEGCNSVSTLASLPINKRSITAVLSAATGMSLSSSMSVGQELYIRCVAVTAFVQPIPTSGMYTSMSGLLLDVDAGDIFEISIWCYASNKYSISIKTED